MNIFKNVYFLKQLRVAYVKYIAHYRQYLTVSRGDIKRRGLTLRLDFARVRSDTMPLYDI